MRGRRALAAALLAYCGAALGAPPPEASLDQLMQLLAAHPHTHVAFTEMQTLAMLDRPLESSGELLYDAPDRLEKRTLKPKPEDLTLDHGVLTAQRGRHKRTLELAAYPQLGPLIESLRATMSGDRTALERAFAVQLSGDLADWTLTLTPHDAAVARIVREVRIAGARAELKSVEISQADGDRTRLTLGPELAP